MLRLLLPDRPGSLGAVATALGNVEADILAMDIVERTHDQAVDDLVVDLPSGRQPDVLITAAETVPGVRVESVRPDPGVAGRHKEWELVEELAAEPTQALSTLARMLPKVLRAGWAVVVRSAGGQVSEVLAEGGGAPTMTGLTAAWAPLRRASELDADAGWVPADWKAIGTEMAAAPIGDPELVVIVGRPGGPALRTSEVARLAHLAGLAATVLDRADRT